MDFRNNYESWLGIFFSVTRQNMVTSSSVLNANKSQQKIKSMRVELPCRSLQWLSFESGNLYSIARKKKYWIKDVRGQTHTPLFVLRAKNEMLLTFALAPIWVLYFFVMNIKLSGQWPLTFGTRMSRCIAEYGQKSRSEQLVDMAYGWAWFRCLIDSYVKLMFEV